MGSPKPSPEEIVFKLFAKAARKRRMKVVEGTIQRRDPPEPDILCDVEGVGPVAFELTECLEEELARNAADKVKLERLLSERYATLPSDAIAKIAASVGNALVYLVFRRGVTLHAKMKTVPGILEMLMAGKFDSRGEAQGPLPPGVSKMKVTPRAYGSDWQCVHFVAERLRNDVLNRCGSGAVLFAKQATHGT